MSNYWNDAEAAFIAQAQDAALGPRKRKKNLPKGAASDSDEDQLKVGTYLQVPYHRYACCVVKNHDYSHTEIYLPLAFFNQMTIVIQKSCYHQKIIPIVLVSEFN